MRQQIGIEYYKAQRDESCGGAKHLLCSEKDDQRQQQCERCHRHVNAKQHFVGIILEQKIFTVEKGFGLEETVLGLRHRQRHMQQRQRSEQFHQRRVFGIQAKVRVLPGHVSGVDMVVFVPRDGIAPGGKGELQEKREEKNGDSAWNKPTPVTGGLRYRLFWRIRVYLHYSSGTSKE